MSLALLAGGAQAAFGIGKAIYGQSQKSKAAAAAKKAANKKYALTKANLYAGHARAIDQFNADVEYTSALWNAKIGQAKSDMKFINEHAADTYFLRQQQLNQQFQKLAFEDQDRAVRFAKSQGVSAAKAQQGVTAGRFDVAAAAIKGRNEAIQAREVTGMIDSFDKQSEINYKINKNKLSNIARSISILPQFGRAPTVPIMPEKPSGFDVGQGQMWAEIAGAAVDGITTFASLHKQDPNLFSQQKGSGLGMGNYGGISGGSQYGASAFSMPSFGSGGFKF